MKIKPKHVCIQGLGFVGSAMAVAVANARSEDGKFLYQVTGIDRDTPTGRERVAALSNGEFPFSAADTNLSEALKCAFEVGNLSATTDESVYESANVVVSDVGVDIPFLEEKPGLEMGGLKSAFRSVAQRIPEGALFLVETTVPPGTCEKILAPILDEELRRRGLGKHSVHLAHSFERVMPGDSYLESIVSFWRVYAGQTSKAASVCEKFLSSIIDVDNYPLTRLSTMTASETAKVMENTYRSVNIAFIDEWTKFAEAIGIDLYEVVDAIRVRPTHSNIRFPGLGVGGYCLTKDPAFAPAGAQYLFERNELEFPFSRLAMKVNHAMPKHTFVRLESLLGGDYKNRSILLLGVSYRQNVGDTRHSPVESLARDLEKRGARVIGFDPYISYWPEMNRSLPRELPDPSMFDAVVLTTPHRQFLDLNILDWLGSARPIVLDTANVVNNEERQRYRVLGIQIESVGRGEGL